MATAKLLMQKPAGGNMDPGLALRDVVLFLTGETNIANFTYFADDSSNILVNTKAAGWELVRDMTTGITSGYVRSFMIRAPVDNSPGKWKYVTLSVKSSGDVHAITGNSDPGTGDLPANLIGNAPAYGWTPDMFLSLDKSYYMFMSASERHFAVFPNTTSSYPYVMAHIERTRLDASWDTPASDYPVAGFWRGGSCQTLDMCSGAHHNAMNQIDRVNSPTGYVGVLGAHNSQSSFNATYDDGGTTKYLMYKPYYAYQSQVLGEVHPDIPLWLIGTKGTGDKAIPSKDVGARVKIGADDYEVIAASYAATTNYPYYVKYE